MDHTFELPFTFHGILDLNKEPAYCETVKNPVEMSETHNVGCYCLPCCCGGGGGPITFSIKLPRSGFIPGESIPFRIEMRNGSSRSKVDWSTLGLKRVVTYNTRGRQKVEASFLVELEGPGVLPGQEEIWEERDKLKVPEGTPPTGLAGCKIIEVEYKLEVGE
jgi:hypothetical protein